ncbi:hypothetical protein BDV96DRAFT_575912 [Lophiotrema nucula]|uniref:Secreted protein n=1 Tax=Lophiotrema nucula TaxID=690887 RepID=A0A6A5Z5Q1_9PLEO|nr:hypothetical protein BDV96DRAFT_575912 [Lophiotrema nucula]
MTFNLLLLRFSLPPWACCATEKHIGVSEADPDAVGVFARCCAPAFISSAESIALKPPEGRSSGTRLVQTPLGHLMTALHPSGKPQRRRAQEVPLRRGSRSSAGLCLDTQSSEDAASWGTRTASTHLNTRDYRGYNRPCWRVAAARFGRSRLSRSVPESEASGDQLFGCSAAAELCCAVQCSKQLRRPFPASSDHRLFGEKTTLKQPIGLAAWMSCAVF